MSTHRRLYVPPMCVFLWIFTYRFPLCVFPLCISVHMSPLYVCTAMHMFHWCVRPSVYVPPCVSPLLSAPPYVFPFRVCVPTYDPSFTYMFPRFVRLSVSMSPPFICPLSVLAASAYFHPSVFPLRLYVLSVCISLRIYVPDGIRMYVSNRIVGGVIRFMVTITQVRGWKRKMWLQSDVQNRLGKLRSR